MEKRYIDEYGKSHNITKVLSSGGQGIVYRTSDDNVTVKIEFNSNTREEIKSDEKTKAKINNLMLLPIPNNVNITLPIAIIENYSGYVMQLLNDMIPFGNAFRISEDENEREYQNEWLKKIPAPIEIKNRFEDYIKTGGAKRRFYGYFKVASNLAQLHSSGLVYCDISDNNMFISENMDSNEVWLIDADNINLQIITLKSGYYTPGYGAPEVVSAKGCSFYSDSYALLISFFWQTSINHPFLGDKTENYDCWGGEPDPKEEAFNGKYPWILDKQDSSNEAQLLIPTEIYNSSTLELLDRMFSENGKNDLHSRPSMAEIATNLSIGLNSLVKCEYCQMDYNYFNDECCVYCDTKNEKILKLKTYYYDENKPDNKGNLIQQYVSNLTYINEIPLRIITNKPVSDVDKVALFLNKTNGNDNYILKKEFQFDDVYINEIEQSLIGKYELTTNEITCVITHNNIKKILNIYLGGN